MRKSHLQCFTGQFSSNQVVIVVKRIRNKSKERMLMPPYLVDISFEKRMLIPPFFVGITFKKKDAYTNLFGRFKLQKKRMLIPPYLVGISFKKKGCLYHPIWSI